MQVQEYDVTDVEGIKNLKRPIFALKAEHVEPFFTNETVVDDLVDEIMERICHNTVVVERDEVENNLEYVHPIIYYPIVQLKDDKVSFFVYQRTKGIGESRLLGLNSIGIGGHVDWTPNVESRAIVKEKPCDAIRSHILFDTVYTEFTEEIKELQYLNGLDPRTGFSGVLSTDQVEEKMQILGSHPFALNLLHTIRHQPTPIAAIFDHSNDVGRFHIGLINPIVYTGDRAGVFGSISTGENSLITKGFWDSEVLLKEIDTFENWSQFLIRHFSDCMKNNPRYEAYFKEMLDDRIDHKSISEIKALGTQDPQTGLNGNIDFQTS